MKDGGFVLLQHAENVGEKERYLGMHQWNFRVDGKTVTVRRPGTKTDLGAALAGRATIERTWYTPPPVPTGQGMKHVVIRKTPAT